jgi:hypothetical protein
LSTNDSAESLGTSVYDTFTWAELNGTKTLPKTGVKITPKPNTAGLNGTFYVWHHYTEGNYPNNGTTSRDHFYFIGYEGSHDPPIDYATELPFEVTISFNTNANTGGLDSDLNGSPGSQMTIGESPNLKWKTGVPISNASTQALGNTGVGNITFTPQHVARYYFIMNTADIGVEDGSINGLKIFPNPTNGILKVETNIGASNLDYQISNAQGEIVDQGTLAQTNGTSELRLPEHCSAGTYLFICEAGTTKFTLQ